MNSTREKAAPREVPSARAAMEEGVAYCYGEDFSACLEIGCASGRAEAAKTNSHRVRVRERRA